jgi:hypothetical protein
MQVKELEISIPKINDCDTISYFGNYIHDHISPRDIPIRFAITQSTGKDYKCELGIIVCDADAGIKKRSIFSFSKRKFENNKSFNAILIIPTGIGAEIGGHSGDGGAVARLIAASCDTLITHPNVLNAADINEMTDNTLYVEGSIISRLLMGTVGLVKKRSNRVLVIAENHIEERFVHATVNAVSAARAAMGVHVPHVIVMEHDAMRMSSLYAGSGRAAGLIERFDYLCAIIDRSMEQFDALALATIIKIPPQFHTEYFKKENAGMVNPWGGVEAMLTHSISLLYDKPSAHAPMMSSSAVMNNMLGIVDPRKAAETVSTTYLHSVIKGLHRSPGIVDIHETQKPDDAITVNDISCIIIPDRCVGLPTLAAIKQDIPIIAVKENGNIMQNDLADFSSSGNKILYVDNYLEAAGALNALRAGVSIESVRRPLNDTKITGLFG